MSSPEELLEEFAQAFNRGDFTKCEQLAAHAPEYVTTEHALVSLAEDVAARALPEMRDTLEVKRRTWMAEAALNGQQWACDRIAMEWAKRSDPEYPASCWPTNLGPHDEGAIPAGTVHQWLVQCARRGNREAAYWAGIIDPHDVESLLTAYGDGSPNGVYLPATAARLGAHYASIGSNEAGRWFDLAIAVDGWRWDEWDTAWTATVALAEYIGWAHQYDGLLCGALCRLLVKDAVENSESDRSLLREEAHKPKRLDYRRAINSEAARHATLRHWIEVHRTDSARGATALEAFVDNRFFRSPGESNDLGDWQLALGLFEEIRGEQLELDRIDELTWIFIEHILGTIIPTILRSAGRNVEATLLEERVDALDFTPDSRLFADSNFAASGLTLEEWESFFPYGPPYDSDSDDPADWVLSAELLAFSAEADLDHLFDFERDLLRNCLSDQSLTDSPERDAAEAAQFLADCGLPLWPLAKWTRVWRPVSELADPRPRLYYGSKLWIAMSLAGGSPLPEGMARAFSLRGTWCDVSDLLLSAARIFIRHHQGVTDLEGADEVASFCQAMKIDVKAQIRALRNLCE